MAEVDGVVMRLHCTIESADGGIVVTPDSDIDLDTGSQLRQVLQDVIGRANVKRIDVDMRKVTFLDSSGIGVLVAAHKAAAENGATLRLSHPGPMVRMVLEVTNLFQLLVADAQPAP